MKEFYYDKLDDYLEKSDTYTDAKTIKIYEIISTTHIKAITYLRTALIGCMLSYPEEYNSIIERLEKHNHKKGKMIEQAPIKWG